MAIKTVQLFSCNTTDFHCWFLWPSYWLKISQVMNTILYEQSHTYYNLNCNWLLFKWLNFIPFYVCTYHTPSESPRVTTSFKTDIIANTIIHK